jgi:UDPglucose 6-dehydrogenase
MKIAVIGLGHVGLPTALGFSELGWEALGVDDDPHKSRQIVAGRMPFYEPGAEELLRRGLRSGRFRLAPDVAAATAEAEVVFVCVGTASARRPADTATATTASRWPSIPSSCGKPARSTTSSTPTASCWGWSPPGAATCCCRYTGPCWTASVRRLPTTPGAAGTDPVEERVIVTSLQTAEPIKHAANAFLATKISFINMIADLCEAAGADVTEVARALGLDPRIGPAFLQAAVGFGGYCLPKDLRALIRIGEELGADMALLRAVDAINRQRVGRVVRRLEQVLWVLRGKTVGILGLAFKPGTDAIREAPSLRVVEHLLQEGVALRLHDPQAVENFRRVVPEEPPAPRVLRFPVRSCPRRPRVGGAHRVARVRGSGPGRSGRGDGGALPGGRAQRLGPGGGPGGRFRVRTAALVAGREGVSGRRRRIGTGCGQGGTGMARGTDDAKRLSWAGHGQVRAHRPIA